VLSSKEAPERMLARRQLLDELDGGKGEKKQVQFQEMPFSCY
jgi:hypothetical protein